MQPNPETHEHSSPPRLSHDIAWVLLFKLMAMSVLWYFFFSSSHVVVVTPAKVETVLFPAPAAPPAAKPRS